MDGLNYDFNQTLIGNFRMPELPDIELYLQAFNDRLAGRAIEKVIVKSPFVVRTFSPGTDECVGKTIHSFERLGKRIVWCLDENLFLIVHLMIAGRFHLRKPQTFPRGKNDLVAFQFKTGTLMLTEASTKKRASIHVVASRAEMEAFRPPGIEVDTMNFDEFCNRLDRENHTLKRSLTDPRIFSGIGNAYSDEILHAARLSPVKWTSRLTNDERIRLFDSVKNVMSHWTSKLMAESGSGFPEKITAFRPDMAVHGKFDQPCPDCSTRVQRIRYADRETNYCPRCQTEGKLLADRSLSRLLKEDWPSTIEELEGESGNGS